MAFRTRALRFVAAGAVALAAFAYSVAPEFATGGPHGTIGAWVDPVDGTVRAVAPGSPAEEARLAPGDRIAVERMTLRDRLQLFGGAVGGARVVSIDVAAADGRVRATTVRIDGRADPAADAAIPRVRLASYTVSLIVAALLVGMLGGAAAWLFLGFVVCTAPTYQALLASAALPELLLRLSAVVAVVPIAGGFVMAAFVLRAGDRPGEPWSRAQRAVAGLAAVAVVGAVVEGFVFERFTHAWLEFFRDAGYLVAVAAVVVRLRTVAPDRLERVRLIGAASLPIVIAQAVTIAYATFGRFGALDSVVSGRIAALVGSATVVVPFAVAYALGAPDVGNARRALVRGASRVLVVGAIVVGAFALVGSLPALAERGPVVLVLAGIVAIAFALAVRSFLATIRSG